jgi:nucleoid-associated protein YgaU
MFTQRSRYAQVPDAVYVDADGREIPYKLLRLAPAPPADVAGHLVVAGDRLDLLAHRYLGDPELYWRICDANLVLRPEELTAETGRRISIPVGAP